MGGSAVQATTEDLIRLMIVDDHAGVRAGIRSLLREAPEVRVIGEAENGPQAVQLARERTPNFVLLDMELPLMGGNQVMRELLKMDPAVFVLVVSSHNDPVYITEMLAGGAKGYLLKEDVPSQLVAAIRSIIRRETKAWLSEKSAALVAMPASSEQELTWRELAILQHLAEGKPEDEVASLLNLPEKQLGKHLLLLMHKFDAASVEALAEIGRKMRRAGD